MAMPWQLARAKRPRRSTPRPIVEQLPRIDIADLCRWNVFPNQCDLHKAHLLELPFRYPFVKNLVISLQDIEANHVLGYTQVIPLRWCRTGFGGNVRPRPLFVCQCGRSARRLYFRHGNLSCRRCINATYASRTCSKRLRPILQAKRVQAFLEFKTYMSQRNRQRIKARISTAPQQDFNSKRLSHYAIQHPQHNYGTQGAMHWR
jgi:hypothetical protein